MRAKPARTVAVVAMAAENVAIPRIRAGLVFVMSEVFEVVQVGPGNARQDRQT
jgi:hypothetical protein